MSGAFPNTARTNERPALTPELQLDLPLAVKSANRCRAGGIFFPSQSVRCRPRLTKRAQTIGWHSAFPVPEQNERATANLSLRSKRKRPLKAAFVLPAVTSAPHYHAHAIIIIHFSNDFLIHNQIMYSQKEKQIVFAPSFLPWFSHVSTQLKDAPKTPAFPPFL